MSEPNGIVAITALGAPAAGFLAAFNGEAATGSLFGALVYFTTTEELPMWKRVAFFLTSFVMGYLFSPALIELELWGMRPLAYPGPAGFAAAGLVVTVMLAAIKRRGSPPGAEARGGSDG